MGTGLVVNRSITPPVVSLTGGMKKLSSGDLSVDITGAGRADELGEMSCEVEVFKANMLEF